MRGAIEIMGAAVIAMCCVLGNSGVAASETPTLTQYLVVPVSGYDRPIFLAQGAQDLMVPAPLVVPLVAGLLGNGQDVTFVPYPSGHGTTMLASAEQSTPFVHRLLDPR